MPSQARTFPTTTAVTTPPAAASPLKRRGLVLGAGAAAAAALAVKALPESPAQAGVATAAADAVAGEGYRLTPHVLRYYQTAKV